MKKYQLLHQELAVTPFTLGVVHRGFHHKLQLKYTAPLYFKNSVIIYKNQSCDWHGDHENFSRLGQKIIADACQKSDYKDNLLKDTIKIGEKLFKENKKIDKTDLRKLSDKQLAAVFANIYSQGSDLCDIGMVAAAPDVAFDYFSKLLKSLISEKIKTLYLKRTANEYFNILTNDGRGALATQERLALLKLAASINKNHRLKKVFNMSETRIAAVLKNSYPIIFKKIETISRDYQWLTFGHLGPVKSLNEHVGEIRTLLLEGDMNAKIKTIPQEYKHLKTKQAQYFKELKFSTSEKQLFLIAQNFSYNKAYRYDMLLYTYYILDKILREISTRIKIGLSELRYCSPEEIIAELMDKKRLNRAEIKARQKLCVVLIKGRGVVHLVGQRAEKYIRDYIIQPEVKKNITTIHGTAASLGRVTGRVKIVNSVKDMAKVEEGDILVSVQTTPDLVPAMKKAAAFVTDVGGITSHAAIVAREMKKPCVIGTKFATKVLHDGDLVDVNANEGDVKIITV